MAVEIRELVVRVNVGDEPQNGAELSASQKKALVDACVKKVKKELDTKKRR